MKQIHFLCILLSALLLTACDAKKEDAPKASLQAYNPPSSPPPAPRMEVLSWSPRIFVIHNFLTEEECDHIIHTGKPGLERSRVVDNETDKPKLANIRTSHGMFFPSNHGDPVLQGIEKRIAMLTLIPEEHAESLHLLHYSLGAEYKPHHDYFDRSTVGGAAAHDRGGQRVASLLMYLNTPEEGGETIFPTAKLTVKAEKGKAVLFYNTLLDGTVDPTTLHGGAPVLKGEKWLATRWLRQHVFK